MELIKHDESVKKIQPLTCAEIGILMASHTFGDTTLSMVSDCVYIGALMLFDLYEHNLIDLMFQVKKQ